MQLYEFMNPHYFRDPFQLYRKLHDQGPLISAGEKGFICPSHATIKSLLNDRRVGKNYLDSIRLRFGEDAVKLPVFRTLSRMFLVLNPPEHDRQRKLIMRFFSNKKIAPFRKMAFEVANDLADALTHHNRHSCDLARDFASPLTAYVICRILGIPDIDAIRLGTAASTLACVFDPLISESNLIRASQAFTVMENYFSTLVVSRRPDNLIYREACLQDRLYDGKNMPYDNTVANAILLFIGGYVTLSNMICNAFLALHENPLEMERLRHDPSLITAAVKECLRYDTSVHILYRTALEDIEINGMKIPCGSCLCLSLGAANHDPQVYSLPEVMDIRRNEAPSLAFGNGIHRCIGFRLAQAKLEIALNVLLYRLPEMRPKTAGIRYNERVNIRGISCLPVVW